MVHQITTVDSERFAPELTIVIPVYNSEQYIHQVLEKLDNELRRAAWDNARILVVNDGSTDGTASVIEQAKLCVPVTTVTQVNKGRFEARRTGINAADSEWILLLDARVIISDHSLQFLLDQIRAHPNREMWNAHIDIRAETLFGRFWIPIIRTAWRPYFRRTGTFSISSKDYDKYPKGTGCFLVRKAILVQALDDFKSAYDDLRYANDDTLLIKSAVSLNRLWFDRRFRAEYVARTSLGQFVRHSFHRGIVFFDGHIRGWSRYGKLFITGASLLIGMPVGAATYPLQVFGTYAILYAPALTLTAVASSSDFRSMIAFALFLPVFVVVFLAGVLRGLMMLVKQSVLRRC